jgi:hypothetical protein
MHAAAAQAAAAGYTSPVMYQLVQATEFVRDQYPYRWKNGTTTVLIPNGWIFVADICEQPGYDNATDYDITAGFQSDTGDTYMLTPTEIENLDLLDGYRAR